ncbi:SusC/RagA family TonB-linked outer membrane protein [Hymenobacter fodinae]|uniref:SusC/RagA family TonB-linked outer membrane protein n=1 Tax=Hymenobacter fodinae TaxID=2510796 RepID=A0A4Z0PAJ4_9BACT|nr:SusC/RagA family TonB-linked outer membrane protein [Hymenobacter fodinae]TGE09687.1 SusC/RagA family TonB-linked outer membrane protein [Hymenobacter fodinae]
MVRLYSLSLLLTLSIPALAQQPDTLAPRRLGVTITLPDSLFASNSFLSGRLVCTGPGVPITQTVTYYFGPTFPLQEQLRQIAGVQATPYSGAPGAQVAVRIRGAASLSGNAQPLYVVDGIPVFQNTFGAPIRDNSMINFRPAEALEMDTNPLLSIPSEDIETVEVLKGAWETARYGAQGVNGVIRITTKRGRTGPLRVHYAGYGGVQKVRYRYNLLNAREYANLANEAALNAKFGAPYSPEQVATFGKGTDWQDELLRTATVQEHHLSLDGGSARTHYYAGTDYLNQKGTVLNSSLSRYAGRAAIQHQLGQHLKLQAAVGLSETRQRIPAVGAAANALAYIPTVPVRNPDGSYGSSRQYSLNPVQWAQESYTTPQHRRMLAQLGARYEFLPGLALDLRGNLERATLANTTYSPSFTSTAGGQSGDNTALYQQWVLNPALRYTGHFKEDRHVVEASAEAIYQKRRAETETRFYLPGQTQPDFFNISGSSYAANVAAYQLTTSYTLAGRYQVQGGLRRDASSTFTAKDRWQWLPSAQVTWHAGKEAFLQSSSHISQLDAWLGWGFTSDAGNIGRNFFQVPIPNGSNLSGRSNVFLREPTQQLDAGLTLGLLRSQLNLTLGAYTRRTGAAGHLIASSSLFNETSQILSSGLELSVEGIWSAGPLRGTTRLAAAVNRNQFTTDRPDWFYATDYQRTTHEQPLSTFYGLRYQGIDAQGAPKFQDTNGDATSNFLDAVALGSGLPRQLVSLGQHLAYRRVTLQAQLDGMFGYQVYNTALAALDVPEGYFNNGSGRLRNRWTPTNTNTDVPQATYTVQFPGVTTYILQSGNHVRLSSLTLAYNVWEKDSRNISVWIGGNNLFVLSNYRGFDPNVSSAGSDNQQAGIDASTYPTARTILLGLRATL